MVELAVLDLVPVSEGNAPADALRNARDLAQHVQAWGYKRYWVAERAGAGEGEDLAPGLVGGGPDGCLGGIRHGGRTAEMVRMDPEEDRRGGDIIHHG